MERILGIQKDHNCSACLFHGYDLVYFNQEERLSKIKNDSGLPIETLKQISKICNEIDVLVVTGYDCFESENNSIMRILEKIGFKASSSFRFIPYEKNHHLAHASTAFYNSGFESAVVIVRDGRGSTYNLNNGGLAYETTSVYSMDYPYKINLLYKRLHTWGTLNEDTRIVWNNSFPVEKIARPFYVNQNTEVEIRNDFDVGFMYEGVSRSIPFNDDGGKMMGLQSFGTHDTSLPTILDKNNICNMNIFSFDDMNKHRGFNLIDYPKLVSQEGKTNLAYMTQKAFEKASIDLIDKMIERSGKTNLVITGGTTLNVVANTVTRKTLDKDIEMYVEPLCGDEGNCIGMSQLYLHSKNRKHQTKKINPLGACGVDPDYNFKLRNNEEVYTDIHKRDIVNLLCDGKIVALFQGKAEAGPRALGNRSLLFDPRVKNGQDIVNKIKNRENFRPLAASVMNNLASDWFNLEKLEESENMMFAIPVKKEMQEKIPAVVHVDGTCRIQTVSLERNKNYYRLLADFYKVTNIPLLLNTSFNIAGDPIVETIFDAVNTLRKSKIEYLYLPDVNKLIYIKN